MGKPRKLGARAAAAGRRSVTVPQEQVDERIATRVAPSVPARAPRRAAAGEGRLRRLIDDPADRKQDPVERIRAVRSLRSELDALELDAWQAGRRQGLSWLRLAEPLGITRSAAQQRLAALERRRGGS